MKKSVMLGLVLLMAASLNAQWGKKIKGNGNVVTEERSTGDYGSVSISGFFDVTLIDGSEGELTLKGEENLLEHIVTEVKNGNLVVKVENGVNLSPSSWKDGISITIPVESIDGLTLSGSGDIVSKKTLESSDFRTDISGSGNIVLTVKAETISANISGSGDMELSGYANNLEVSVSGSGNVKAYGLEAQNVNANISGSADMQVTATESIKARVSGSGDISYRGNPKKIDTKSSGSGDVSKG
ncbi:MAG: head GIN domain-containing protein [Sediminicola sp.]